MFKELNTIEKVQIFNFLTDKEIVDAVFLLSA